MTQTLTVPRVLGGTLIITYTPAAPPPPNATVYIRSGQATVDVRSGQATASIRSGQATVNVRST